MMTRSKLREHIFILLFEAEFNSPDEMPEQVRLYFDELEKPADDKSEKYIQTKVSRILEKTDELDSLINLKSEGWSTKRMGRVELAIMRLALYEIKFDDDIPVGVAIDEAVELAKKYGQDDAGSFVNGVLAKFSGSEDAAPEASEQ